MSAASIRFADSTYDMKTRRENAGSRGSFESACTVFPRKDGALSAVAAERSGAKFYYRLNFLLKNCIKVIYIQDFFSDVRKKFFSICL